MSRLLALVGATVIDGTGRPPRRDTTVEVKTAGIKTTTTHDFDCDDPSVGGSPLLSTNVQFLPHALSAADYWTAVGKAEADYLIAQTNGKAQVLDLTFPEVTYVSYLDKGLKAGIAACSGCKIVDTLELSVQDQATNEMPTKLSSALLKDTSANALYVPFESLFPFGGKQAIVSSGRGSQLAVLGGEGEPTNLSYIKSGQPGENRVIATSEAWCGSASVDELNRAFAGQPAVPEGIGYQLLTRNNVTVEATAGTSRRSTTSRPTRPRGASELSAGTGSATEGGDLGVPALVVEDVSKRFGETQALNGGSADTAAGPRARADRRQRVR